MARGYEEVSSSQVGRRRGTPQEMPDELKSHLFLVHFSVLFSVIIE